MPPLHFRNFKSQAHSQPLKKGGYMIPSPFQWHKSPKSVQSALLGGSGDMPPQENFEF